MKKSMHELYKIIQMNHLWTVGSKSKHFSECNIKKKRYSAQHQISRSQRTCRLRRLTDIPKTRHQTLRAWFWCYRCFIENTCLGSLSLHLVTIWQMPVHFSIDCLNLLWFSTWPCGQYWHDWWGNPSSRRELKQAVFPPKPPLHQTSLCPMLSD